MYTYLYTYKGTHIPIYIYVGTHIHMYIYICTGHTYIYTYIHIYVYTHTDFMRYRRLCASPRSPHVVCVGSFILLNVMIFRASIQLEWSLLQGQTGLWLGRPQINDSLKSLPRLLLQPPAARIGSSWTSKVAKVRALDPSFRGLLCAPFRGFWIDILFTACRVHQVTILGGRHAAQSF